MSTCIRMVYADLNSCSRDHRADSTINDHYLAILQKKFEHPWPIMINSDRIQKQKVWVCILALPCINFVLWGGQLLWFHFLLKEGIIIAHKLHRAVGGLDWTVQVWNFACKCTCAQDTLKVNSEASLPATWLGRSGVGLGNLCPETSPPRGFWCKWCRRYTWRPTFSKFLCSRPLAPLFPLSLPTLLIILLIPCCPVSKMTPGAPSQTVPTPKFAFQPVPRTGAWLSFLNY